MPLVGPAVGALGRRLIAKRKRSTGFTTEDWDRWVAWIDARGGVRVTQKDLAKTSSPLRQEPEL